MCVSPTTSLFRGRVEGTDSRAARLGLVLPCRCAAGTKHFFFTSAAVCSEADSTDAEVFSYMVAQNLFSGASRCTCPDLPHLRLTHTPEVYLSNTLLIRKAEKILP